MYKFLIIIFLLGSISLYSQSGINTKIPQGTLQVMPVKTNGTTPEGVLLPRLKGDALYQASVNGVYGSAQNGILVFVTEPPAELNQVGQLAGVNKRGYYYFDNSKNQWMNMSASNSIAPEIKSIDCNAVTISDAVFTKGVVYDGTLTVPYTGGNGAAYTSTFLKPSSTTVYGITISLQAGVLNQGAGILVYTVKGTPTRTGTFQLPISTIDPNCKFSFTVN